MAQAQTLSRNQQIVLDIIEKAKGPLKAYSILFNVQKKGINAPQQIYRALDKLIEMGKIHKIESKNAFVACRSSDCEISKEENKPIITDNKPPIIDNLTICVGLLETFLAIAAGIINIPVISRRPTILIDIAIIAANKTVKIAFTLSGFMPSASASS